MFILFNGSTLDGCVYCIYEDVVDVVVCTRNKNVYFYKIINFLVDHQPKIKIYSQKKFFIKNSLFSWHVLGLGEGRKSLRGNDKNFDYYS